MTVTWQMRATDQTKPSRNTEPTSEKQEDSDTSRSHCRLALKSFRYWCEGADRLIACGTKGVGNHNYMIVRRAPSEYQKKVNAREKIAREQNTPVKQHPSVEA